MRWCRRHRTGARERYSDARERAQLLASQTGVRLGKLLAFAVSGETATNPEGECRGGGENFSPGSMPMPSAESYLRVRIDSNVTMRFAIK